MGQGAFGDDGSSGPRDGGAVGGDSIGPGWGYGVVEPGGGGPGGGGGGGVEPAGGGRGGGWGLPDRGTLWAGGDVRLSGVGGDQAVVDERGHECQERRDQGACHDVVHEVAQPHRQDQEDQAEDDGEGDQDQDHKDIGAEHPPRVTTHGAPAVAERFEHPRPREHDERDDQAPERQQDKAGHDEQDEADKDADAGQDGRPDNRQQERYRGLHRLGQVQVDPPVADILHRFDQRCLQHIGGHEADDGPEDRANDADERQQGDQDRSDQIDHEGDQKEVAREPPV